MTIVNLKQVSLEKPAGIKSKNRMKMTILNVKYVSPGKKVEPLSECRHRVGRAERKSKNMSSRTRLLDHGADIVLKAEQTTTLISKRIKQKRMRNQR